MNLADARTASSSKFFASDGGATACLPVLEPSLEAGGSSIGSTRVGPTPESRSAMSPESAIAARCAPTGSKPRVQAYRGHATNTGCDGQSARSRRDRTGWRESLRPCHSRGQKRHRRPDSVRQASLRRVGRGLPRWRDRRDLGAGTHHPAHSDPGDGRSRSETKERKSAGSSTSSTGIGVGWWTTLSPSRRGPTAPASSRADGPAVAASRRRREPRCG